MGWLGSNRREVVSTKDGRFLAIKSFSKELLVDLGQAALVILALLHLVRQSQSTDFAVVPRADSCRPLYCLKTRYSRDEVLCSQLIMYRCGILRLGRCVGNGYVRFTYSLSLSGSRRGCRVEFGLIRRAIAHLFVVRFVWYSGGLGKLGSVVLT
jgi:hypothetical protein